MKVKRIGWNSLLLLAALARCSSPGPQSSSSSNWVACKTVSDCALAPTAVACTNGYCVDSNGERVQNLTDGGAQDASGSVIGVSDRNPHCPSDVPESGTPCAASVACEYLTTPAPTYCAIFAACGANGGGSLQWTVGYPDPSCGNTASSCPATFGSGEQNCQVNATCDYPEGRCTCVECTSTTSAWLCEQSRDDCPSGALLGDACTSEGTICGACGVAPAMTCRNGYWDLAGAVPCPVISACG